LNPAQLGPLPAAIEQRHVAGGRDRVMPPDLIETAAVQLGARGAVVLPDVAHTAGWEEQWPAILAGHWTDDSDGD
jgi:hypothetical protein